MELVAPMPKIVLRDNEIVCPSCQGSGKSDDGPCSPPGICSRCNGDRKIKMKGKNELPSVGECQDSAQDV